MSVSFDGQVAIVTGAGRGLGRAYARELGALGARVVVNDLGGSIDGSDRSAAPADEVCEEIRSAGGEAVASYASVASMEGGQSIVQTALDTWDRVDAVVCNAGILRDRTFLNMTEDDWDAVFDVHIKGCFTLLKAAWPRFREQRYGRAVLCTSGTGLYGNFGQSNYGAAKAAMLGLMNVIKLEGEKYGIGVNLLAPGARTRMTEGLMEDGAGANAAPEHVAPVVAYLASRECSDSGVIIEAIGGRYNRSVMVRGPGVNFDPGERKDVSWVAAHWDEITRLDAAQPLWDLMTPLEKHDRGR